MTATLERSSQPAGGSRKGRQQASIGAPARPQVNLLPPEVHAARTVGRVKRWLLFVIVLAILVAAGVVFLGILAQRAADDELAVQQRTTETLLEEQRQYAEVPVVLSQLEDIRSARELGMSTEVLWRDYLAAIAATAPEGISIETFSGVVPGPTEAPPSVLNPLDVAGVGTITFAANSSTVPDTAAWIDALSTIPGLKDPWFTSAVFTDGEQGSYYSVNGTVQVDTTALAERFAETEEEQ